MTILAERDALVSALDDIPVGNATFNVVGLRQSFDAPALMVIPRAPFEWTNSFVDGDETHHTITWLVRAFVPCSDTDEAETALLGALELIAAAIDGVPSMGVEHVSEYGLLTGLDGTEYLTVEFIVESIT